MKYHDCPHPRAHLPAAMAGANRLRAGAGERGEGLTKDTCKGGDDMLKNIRHDLLQLEQQANRLRQRIEDSEYTEQEDRRMDKPKVQIVSDEEWSFTEPQRGNGVASMLAEYMALLVKQGDKIKIGPFDTYKDAKSAQSQLGHAAYDALNWPRQNGADGKPIPAYTSHIEKKTHTIYVMRTYAPH